MRGSVLRVDGSVPDLGEAADGGFEGGQVAAVDAALGEAGREGLEEGGPFVGGAWFDRHGYFDGVADRLLDLYGAGHHAHLGLVLAFGSAGLPGAVSAAG